jgi:hypothetical protein
VLLLRVPWKRHLQAARNNILTFQNYSIEAKITVFWDMMPCSLVENYQPCDQVGVAITFCIRKIIGSNLGQEAGCPTLILKKKMKGGSRECLAVCVSPPTSFCSEIESRYSCGIQAGRPGFDSRQCKIFLFSTASRSALGPKQIQSGRGMNLLCVCYENTLLSIFLCVTLSLEGAGIATNSELNDREVGVRILPQSRIFCSLLLQDRLWRST